MNNETNRLLDKAAKRLTTESDYSLANALGVSRAAVSKWRSGRNHMADTAAMKLAEILGEPTDSILALVAADRTSDPAAKKQWTNMAKKLRSTAAATAMAALGFTMFPTDAARSTPLDKFAQSLYIMLNYGFSTHSPRNSSNHL
jgi:predicted transcriptional regulator